jgi:hypothetical protein
MLSEPIVPADPLLDERCAEAARESDDEAEEPKDIHVDGIAWRCERVERRGVQAISIREPGDFLGKLLKKPRGDIGGIGLEVLVTLDEECGYRCGEYTRLVETGFDQKVLGTPTSDFKNVHKRGFRPCRPSNVRPWHCRACRRV